MDLLQPPPPLELRRASATATVRDREKNLNFYHHLFGHERMWDRRRNWERLPATREKERTATSHAKGERRRGWWARRREGGGRRGGASRGGASPGRG
jgi:hypothetical protein